MLMNSHCRSGWLFGLLVVCAAGCGGGEKGPEFVIVHGKITVDGAPLKGLMVGFSPDLSKKTRGPMSAGQTDAAGEYKLAGPGGRAGAVVGFHNVTVTCPIIGSTMDGKPPEPTSPCKLPDTLADPQQSGLTAEVKAGGGPINFDLKSRP